MRWASRRVAATLLATGVIFVGLGASAQAAVNDQIPAAEPGAEGTVSSSSTSTSTSSTDTSTSSISSTSTDTSSTVSSTSVSTSSTSPSVSDSSASTSSEPSVVDSNISSSGVGGTLARTGADPGLLLLLGGGLVVTGVLVLRYRPREA
jgi:hypothetical protein